MFFLNILYDINFILFGNDTAFYLFYRILLMIPRSMVYRNPVYFLIVFAFLIVITTLRITYILQLSDESQRIPAKSKKTITHFFGTGAALFALGFLIWNIDNVFCVTLTTWKVSVGWPIAFLLESQFLCPLIGLAYTSLTLFFVR